MLRHHSELHKMDMAWGIARHSNCFSVSGGTRRQWWGYRGHDSWSWKGYFWTSACTSIWYNRTWLQHAIIFGVHIFHAVISIKASVNCCCYWRTCFLNITLCQKITTRQKRFCVQWEWSTRRSMHALMIAYCTEMSMQNYGNAPRVGYHDTKCSLTN